MPDRYQMMLERQQVLADFGEFALRSDSLEETLQEACRLVADALGTRRAKVLQLDEDKKLLLLRAGVGWDNNIVGVVRLPMSEHSSETYSIRVGAPVISRNIMEDERFEPPQ